MKKIVVLVIAFATLAGAAIAVAAFNQNFGTHLRGRTENPPRDTQAQGQALFHLADDGQSREYKVIVANIDNAFIAHRHISPAGADDPSAQCVYAGRTPGETPSRAAGKIGAARE